MKSLDTFNRPESRQIPITDLVRRKNYLELVPRPTPEEFRQLKEDIAREGFNQKYPPMVVNENTMVLVDGYTRLQIAEELGIKDVWVMFCEFKDHLEEKLYILKSALNRRHLTRPQQSELLLMALDVEEERARDRQKQAGEQIGKNNLKQFVKDQGNRVDNHDHQLNQNSGEAGQATKIVVQGRSISHDTLSRTKKIVQAAQTDPEIAGAWDKAKLGEGSINSVYQQVKEKEKEKENQNGEVKPRPKVVYAKIKSRKEELAYYHKKMQEEEEALNVPREELVETFRKVAIARNMPMDAVEALMESDPDFLEVWKHLRLGLVTPAMCWCVVYWKIHAWLRARQGLEPDREFGRMIHQEMKKSACVYMMQFALRLLRYYKYPVKICSLLSGVDRKLFPLMLAYEDRLDLLVDKIRLRPACPPLFLEKARKLREKGKEDEARSVRTLGVITYLRDKWDKEDEMERQRFGGPSNCLMKT